MSAVNVAAPSINGSVWSELVAELPIGVMLQDDRGTVLTNNDLAADLLGLSRAELRSGVRPAGWHACDDSGTSLPDDAALADQVLRIGVPMDIPIMVTRRGRPHVRLWAKYHPVSHRGRPRLLVLLRPVQTDVGRSSGVLDPLTGLPSRVLLLDRADQALTRARTHGTLASLVLLGLSGMAGLNAELGFRHGDYLLTTLADRLRDGLRADQTVGRYGGDRFVVVAEHPHGTGEAVAAQVRELVEQPVRIGAADIRPTARMCWVTSDGSDPVHAVITHLESRLDA